MITTSLDQAFGLLVDPYELFNQAPDGVKLLLVQAVFDKLWIMDNQVAGAELNDTFHELPTTEAQLTLSEQSADAAEDELRLVPTARTYYRRG